MSKISDMLGPLVEWLVDLAKTSRLGPVYDLMVKVTIGKSPQFWWNAFKRFLRGDPNPFGESVYVVDVNYARRGADVIDNLLKAGFVCTGTNGEENLRQLFPHKYEVPSLTGPDEVVFKIFPQEDREMSYNDVVTYMKENILSFVTPYEALCFIESHPELADKILLKAFTHVTGNWDRNALGFRRGEVLIKESQQSPIGPVDVHKSSRVIVQWSKVHDSELARTHDKKWRFLAKKMEV